MFLCLSIFSHFSPFPLSFFYTPIIRVLPIAATTTTTTTFWPVKKRHWFEPNVLSSIMLENVKLSNGNVRLHLATLRQKYIYQLLNYVIVHFFINNRYCNKSAVNFASYNCLENVVLIPFKKILISLILQIFQKFTN